MSLRVERDGNVAVLTLDRPEVLNAFDEALTTALAAAMSDAAADAGVRAVVVTGAGARSRPGRTCATARLRSSRAPSCGSATSCAAAITR